ncbi:collagen alpha-1(I) chain-like [Cynocephalus volans]|uniref:collagen alpha-1(I) chain-like n=1 Tax=Cynocephalus volans TaxID=110931 RepID=UPI002FCA6D23
MPPGRRPGAGSPQPGAGNPPGGSRRPRVSGGAERLLVLPSRAGPSPRGLEGARLPFGACRMEPVPSRCSSRSRQCGNHSVARADRARRAGARGLHAPQGLGLSFPGLDVRPARPTAPGRGGGEQGTVTAAQPSPEEEAPRTERFEAAAGVEVAGVRGEGAAWASPVWVDAEKPTGLAGLAPRTRAQAQATGLKAGRRDPSRLRRPLRSARRTRRRRGLVGPGDRAEGGILHGRGARCERLEAGAPPHPTPGLATGARAHGGAPREQPARRRGPPMGLRLTPAPRGSRPEKKEPSAEAQRLRPRPFAKLRSWGASPRAFFRTVSNRPPPRIPAAPPFGDVNAPPPGARLSSAAQRALFAGLHRDANPGAARTRPGRWGTWRWVRAGHSRRLMRAEEETALPHLARRPRVRVDGADDSAASPRAPQSGPQLPAPDGPDPLQGCCLSKRTQFASSASIEPFRNLAGGSRRVFGSSATPMGGAASTSTSAETGRFEHHGRMGTSGGRDPSCRRRTKGWPRPLPPLRLGSSAPPAGRGRDRPLGARLLRRAVGAGEAPLLGPPGAAPRRGPRGDPSRALPDIRSLRSPGFVSKKRVGGHSHFRVREFLRVYAGLWERGLLFQAGRLGLAMGKLRPGSATEPRGRAAGTGAPGPRGGAFPPPARGFGDITLHGKLTSFCPPPPPPAPTRAPPRPPGPRAPLASSRGCSPDPTALSAQPRPHRPERGAAPPRPPGPARSRTASGCDPRISHPQRCVAGSGWGARRRWTPRLQACGRRLGPARGG